MTSRSVWIGAGIVVVLGVGLGILWRQNPSADAVPVPPSQPAQTAPTNISRTQTDSSPPASSVETPPTQTPSSRVEVAPAPRRIPDQYLYPNDTGGLLTRQVLAPQVPPLPMLPTRQEPMPWRSSLERAEFPLPRTVPDVPSLPTDPPPSPRLTPLGAVVPLDLGRGAEVDLRTIRLPGSPQ